MAGAPGFEPGNGGTKNRCLTAWLRPKASQAGRPYTSVVEKHNRAEVGKRPTEDRAVKRRYAVECPACRRRFHIADFVGLARDSPPSYSPSSLTITRALRPREIFDAAAVGT